jgi:site-specific DNA-cytosine methylase
VLIGGPPCQPFSKAGYWSKGDSGRLDDPRAATLGAYLRVLEDTTPAAFLLENVEGLAYRGKDEGLRLLLDAIEGVNKRTKSKYRPTMQVVMAADYGVPQLRKRFIMIAARDGTEFTFPKPTHAAPQLEQTSLFDRLPPYRTAWDALADVGPDEGEDVAVRGRWAELLPSIPEGHNYLWHTDRMGGMPLFGWRRRYWSFLLKLAKSQPSWTVQAQPGPAVGTVPLGQPAARHARARADPDLPRRRPGDREPDRDPAPDRQRGALAARGGPGPRDLGAAPWQPSPQGSAAPAAHRSLPRTGGQRDGGCAAALSSPGWRAHRTSGYRSRTRREQANDAVGHRLVGARIEPLASSRDETETETEAEAEAETATETETGTETETEAESESEAESETETETETEADEVSDAGHDRRSSRSGRDRVVHCATATRCSSSASTPTSSARC